MRLGCVLCMGGSGADIGGSGTDAKRWSLRSITRLPAIIWFMLATAAPAGDWPEILGPHRNGQAENERLAETWPAAGPKILWRYKLGSGYAGPAVVGDRVVIFH